jgi:gamma-glutamylcyclotransferase (GGCT)/AIG2-like uncharacterized protein YtfP
MSEFNNLLFTYGTLLDEPTNPYAQMVFDEGDFLGEAYFQGQLYDIGDYPGTIDSKDPRDRVIGRLHQLRDASILSNYLDDYEGCGPNDTEPYEFVRVQRDVIIARDGKKLKAWIYLYNLPVKGYKRIPGGSYLQDLTES